MIISTQKNIFLISKLLLLSFILVQLTACGGGGGSSVAVPSTPPPAITSSPQDQLVVAGSTANFNVTATGSGSLNYQWYKAGIVIPGATTNTFSISPTTLSDDGSIFSVGVTNSGGTTTSSTAKLSVRSPASGSILMANSSGQLVSVSDNGLVSHTFPSSLIYQPATGGRPGTGYIGGPLTFGATDDWIHWFNLGDKNIYSVKFGNPANPTIISANPQLLPCDQLLCVQNGKVYWMTVTKDLSRIATLYSQNLLNTTTSTVIWSGHADVLFKCGKNSPIYWLSSSGLMYCNPADDTVHGPIWTNPYSANRPDLTVTQSSEVQVAYQNTTNFQFEMVVIPNPLTVTGLPVPVTVPLSIDARSAAPTSIDGWHYNGVWLFLGQAGKSFVGVIPGAYACQLANQNGQTVPIASTALGDYPGQIKPLQSQGFFNNLISFDFTILGANFSYLLVDGPTPQFFPYSVGQGPLLYSNTPYISSSTGCSSMQLAPPYTLTPKSTTPYRALAETANFIIAENSTDNQIYAAPIGTEHWFKISDGTGSWSVIAIR